MIRWIFAAAASASLIGAGIVHGYWTDRWNPSTEVNQAVERFADVPVRFGDWDGESIEVKPGQVGAAAAGPRGQFSRFRYPVLHKLYVLRDLSNVPPSGEKTSTGRNGESTGYPERDEVCEAFLKAFLPELDRTLFGNKGG